MGGVTSLRKGASFWYVPVFLFVSLAFVWMFARAYPVTSSNISLNATNVNRWMNTDVLANATWNETINVSWVQYNATNATFYNLTYICITGCSNPTGNNSTAFAIRVNDFSLGAHSVTIYVNSSNTTGNLSTTANTSAATFYVWGWANLTKLNVINGPDSFSNTLLCNITDANTSVPIADYPVSFAVNGTTISTNYTNTTGWANITYNYTSQSTFNFTCSITDNDTLYYNDTAFNFLSQTVSRGFTSKTLENIGFNRTGTNVKVISIPVQNYGSQAITLNTLLNSTFLNYTGNALLYMSYATNTTNSTLVVPANSISNLTINVTVDTMNTTNQQGIYRGWIFLNSTSPTPYTGINVTAEINLTDSIIVDLSCSGCGIFAEDGDKRMENLSKNENSTVKFRAYLANGTQIGADNDINNIKLNMTSFFLVENSSQYRVPTSGSL
ncbi:MAG: hypothetical protein HZB68_01595, partial [Candidatus Aenigmarchaeota archaeon]|nr:hypothetical protein [Candidatus Aenigmarchaeota archaeon]